MTISGEGEEQLTADRPSGQRVARNSLLYFLSLAIPAAAAIVLVPVTVKALGASRFGLLALAWVVAEGSGMFDFGLGRATVRFVADATARGRERVTEVVLSGLSFQTAAGMVAGAVLFLIAPLLAARVFNISGGLMPEASRMFRVLAFHIPVLFAFASLRAALEGAQRFDLSTRLKVLSSLASVAVPAIAARAGASLPTIMWLLLAARLILVLAIGIVVRRTFLPNGYRLPKNLQTIREMLSYSGWVAVSAALGPALASFDRFVVGSIAGAAALGYYTGAAEAANRFLLIPATAFAALLPALSHVNALGENEKVLAGTRAAHRQLAAILLPLCLALLIFAPVILRVWLGPAFAAAAGTPLRILSVGVFLTGLAHLPLALLYGSGRPDIPAKINVAQVLIHVPLTLFLVSRFGLTGAATAWSIRCSEDFVLYEFTRRRYIGRYPADGEERSRGLHLALSAVLLAPALVACLFIGRISAAAGIAGFLISAALYMWFGWFRVLHPSERTAWTSLVRPARLLPS